MPLALPRGPRYTRRPPRTPGPSPGRGGTEGPLCAPPPPREDVTMPEPRSSWAGSAHPPVKAALIGRAAAGKAELVGVAPLGGRGSGRSRRPARPSTGPEGPGPAPPPARRARTRPRADEFRARPQGGGAHLLQALTDGSSSQSPGRRPALRAPATLLPSRPCHPSPPDLSLQFPSLRSLAGASSLHGAQSG